MLDLVVAGSCIPLPLDEVCRSRQRSEARELGRLVIAGGNVEEEIWQYGSIVLISGGTKDRGFVHYSVANKVGDHGNTQSC